MFGELSKLFDRSFAVGFFLPAFLFFSITAIMLNQFIFHQDVTTFQELDWLVFTTVLGLLSLVGGIILLATNRDLYRIIEGYDELNPLKLFGWCEKLRYRFIDAQLKKMDSKCIEYLANGKDIPASYLQKRDGLRYRLTVEFPQDEKDFLPTPFGNSLRSFEYFPHVMYGIDSISTWSRLLAIIPNEYVEMIDSVKSQVDFWVNIGLVSILLQIEYVGLVYILGWQLNWWIVGLLFAVGAFTPTRATSSAREWGEYVKSVFDMYRFELLDSMHIARPNSRDEERELWSKVNRAIQFCEPDKLPDLKKQDPPRKESLLERFFKKT